LMSRTKMEGLHFTWPACKYSYCDICYHIYTVFMPSTCKLVVRAARNCGYKSHEGKYGDAIDAKNLVCMTSTCVPCTKIAVYMCAYTEE